MRAARRAIRRLGAFHHATAARRAYDALPKYTLIPAATTCFAEPISPRSSSSHRSSTEAILKLKGANLRIASVDERWEEEEPETEWRDSPMTMRYYLVTLEDGQQLTIIRNMNYERWYYQAG